MPQPWSVSAMRANPGVAPRTGTFRLRLVHEDTHHGNSTYAIVGVSRLVCRVFYFLKSKGAPTTTAEHLLTLFVGAPCQTKVETLFCLTGKHQQRRKKLFKEKMPVPDYFFQVSTLYLLSFS